MLDGQEQSFVAVLSLGLGLSVVLLLSALLMRFMVRAFALRMPRRIALLGVVISLATVFPWLVLPQLLTSTDFLNGGLIPGTTAPVDANRYELLNDTALQFLPWEMELRRQWRSGEFGFWSDSLEGGSSPWINPQAGVLSPISWVARLFPIQHFFLVKLALKMLLCCLGVAALVRRLGAAWSSGLLAGLAAVLGGALMPWALYAHTDTVAWVPWTTLGMFHLSRRATFRTQSARAVATTGLLIACLLLSGHPEIAFSGAALGALVALCFGGWFPRRRDGSAAGSRNLVSRVAPIIAAAGLGFFLAAPAVLPFLDAVNRSQRSQEVAFFQPHLAEAEIGLRPTSWFTDQGRPLFRGVLNPYAYGVPHRSKFTGPLNWSEAGAAYSGFWVLAGAVLALALGLRRTLPFLLFWLFALLLSAEFIPLLKLARSLPLLSSMAFPRMLLVGSICLAVAAGLGFDAIRRRAANLVAWLAIVAVAVASCWAGGWDNLLFTVVAWVLVAALVFVGEPLSSTRKSNFERGGATDGLGAAASDSQHGLMSAATARWITLAVGSILLAQLPWAWQMLPRSKPEGFYPNSSVLDQLAASVERGEGGLPSRVLGFAFHGYPSLLSVYGFHQTRSHNPMAPVGWLRINGVAFGFEPDAQTYFGEVRRLDGVWLDTLGVGAVLSHSLLTVGEAPFRSAGLVPVEVDDPWLVYRNPDPSPRVFVANSIEVVESGSLTDALRQLDDPRNVFLTTPIPKQFEDSSLPFGVELTATSVRPGELGLTVVRPSVDGGRTSPFLLATTLAGPSGWRVTAYDDSGSSAELLKTSVHGAFLGAWVPADAVRIELQYLPPFLIVGSVASLMALCLVLFLFVRSSALRVRF